MQRKLGKEKKGREKFTSANEGSFKMRRYVKMGAARERLQLHVERPCAGVKEGPAERTWEEADKGW